MHRLHWVLIWKPANRLTQRYSTIYSLHNRKTLLFHICHCIVLWRKAPSPVRSHHDAAVKVCPRPGSNPRSLVPAPTLSPAWHSNCCFPWMSYNMNEYLWLKHDIICTNISQQAHIKRLHSLSRRFLRSLPPRCWLPGGLYCRGFLGHLEDLLSRNLDPLDVLLQYYPVRVVHGCLGVVRFDGDQAVAAGQQRGICLTSGPGQLTWGQARRKRPPQHVVEQRRRPELVVGQDVPLDGHHGRALGIRLHRDGPGDHLQRRRVRPLGGGPGLDAPLGRWRGHGHAVGTAPPQGVHSIGRPPQRLSPVWLRPQRGWFI